MWCFNILTCQYASRHNGVHFLTSELPKVVREWCAFYILTCQYASRHNGVHFLTSELPKVVPERCAFFILTWTCASRHNGVHFFEMSTSKSGPRMVCFLHFDLDMCFAPQRRALFRHLNFQKWSQNGVLSSFWLGHVLRATTACTFSRCQLPKVVPEWCAFFILTWTCASRHNGVHFFDIWTSKSGPRTVCFLHFDLDMCFAPQRRALFRDVNFKCSERGVFLAFLLPNVVRATTACHFSSLIWPAGSAPAALESDKSLSLEKHNESRLSYLFAHLHLLSPLSFSIFLFSDLLTSILLLLDSSHLCFSMCPYCRKLPSKLPSIIPMMFRPLEEHLSSDVFFQQDSARSICQLAKKVKKQIPKCINALGVLSTEGVKGSHCGQREMHNTLLAGGVEYTKGPELSWELCFFVFPLCFVWSALLSIFLAICSIWSWKLLFQQDCNILEFEPLSHFPWCLQHFGV